MFLKAIHILQFFSTHYENLVFKSDKVEEFDKYAVTRSIYPTY